MWNWQQKDWPDFKYDHKALEALETKFIQNSGECFGVFKHISEEEQERLKIDLISEEAFKTSKIEGELLDRDSLQSSIRRQFGLTTDHRRIPPAEHGISEMMVDVYKNFNKPLSHEILWSWHKMVMNGRRGLKDIGAYRTHSEPMQIVSGRIYDNNPKVHFEAPPSDQMESEMENFIQWFNTSAPNQKNALPALTRAGIFHLYFVSIHPFEDGNGRIGRAIAEQSLAQNLNSPTLIALSYTIERHKKDYYTSLEESNKDNNITNWLVYFGQTVLEAQQNTLKRMEFIIQKSKLLQRLQGQLNSRQEKVIHRMFREGIDGFEGGLSAENYISITGATRATATRDLGDLVSKNALSKTGQFKHTRYYLNLID